MPKSKDSSLHWVDLDLPAARADLAEWFARFARDLPWRSTRSVYRTVVSEFMLQQTRVATVLPYFDRWMAAFPGFSELAKADEEEVLRRWQGLGYYSRARNIHRLAQEIEVSGVPTSRVGWKKLPGIGDYSSAAIASLASGEAVAVVDGNVVRVLSRIASNERSWTSSAEAVKAFTPLADAFLDPEQPGVHNEALMELGALVCFPRSPLCTVCPLLRHCSAASKGIAESLPRILKAAKTKRTIDRIWAVVDGSILLRKAPSAEKRLAGMFELPRKEDLASDWSVAKNPMTKKKRGIGNEIITETIFQVTKIGKETSPPKLRWVSLDELEDISLSGPHRRWILELLEIS